MKILNEIIAFILGMTLGVAFLRYGIGLGTRIVYRTKENLPAFGRMEDEPIEQSHTGEGEYSEVEEI